MSDEQVREESKVESKVDDPLVKYWSHVTGCPRCGGMMAEHPSGMCAFCRRDAFLEELLNEERNNK
jgi:ribosomal protein S27AE